VGLFFGYIFKWWAFSVIIGIIAFPISFLLFRKSYDKGYLFSKAIGIFIIGYFSWLLGFINFSTGTILLVIGIMLAFSVYIFLRYKKEILAFMDEKAALIIIAELFYLLVFLVYAYFRMYQPDIIGTEKFMDFAFMNSITKADSMPPFDPWMWGKGLYISYYYFGYVIMAIMFKLTGIPNGVGFNLSLTYTVALSALCMVGLMYNLTKNYVIGFLAAAFLLLISNIDGFMQVATNHWTTNNLNWWHTSRIIDMKEYDVTINEFPFFSFLLGDLHPHQMAIPFVLLALNIALTFIKEEDKNLFEIKFEKMTFLVFSGLVLGGLWFLNSWDFPTYFFITALCIASYKYSSGEKLETWIKDAGMALGVIFVVSIVAYLPFTLFFKSQAKGIGITKANTKITDYLTIYGIMLFPVLSFVVFRLFNWLYALKLQGLGGSKTKKREFFCPRCGSEIREGKNICGQCGYLISGDELLLGGTDAPVKKANDTAIAFFKFLLDPVTTKDKRVAEYGGMAVGLALGMIVYKTMIDWPKSPADFHVFGFFSGLIFLALAVVLLLGMTRVELKENQFVLILIFTALFANWGCEFFHIVDTFSNPGTHAPLERMNTVFKFYYQAWILFSIAAAYGFFWVKHFYLAFKPKPFRWAWYSVFIILIIMGMFYPFAASNVKTAGFTGNFTLDGSDFLQSMSYKGRLSSLGDYQAIQWLKANVKGKPVILEAYGPEYTEYARISSFTGLPTVLGWPGHELQWRGTWDEAGKRQGDVDTIYTTLDWTAAYELMKKYDIKYIYVGALERDKYAANLPGLDKFAQNMDIAYMNKIDTVIYKIRN
jgi:uncharacterized membrane protein